MLHYISALLLSLLFFLSTSRQGVDDNYVLEFYKDSKSSESKGAIPLDLVKDVVPVSIWHSSHLALAPGLDAAVQGGGATSMTYPDAKSCIMGATGVDGSSRCL